MPTVLDLGAGYTRAAIIDLALSNLDAVAVIQYSSPGTVKHPLAKELEANFNLKLNVVLQEHCWGFISSVASFDAEKVKCNNCQRQQQGSTRVCTTNTPNVFHASAPVVIKWEDDKIRLLPSYFVIAFGYYLAAKSSYVINKDASTRQQIEVLYRQTLGEAILIDRNIYKKNYHGYFHQPNY